jgi:radical SAM superfamily enzyme YgiQ (UPF0313 family)
MSGAPRVVLANPAITSGRRARFPLSLLSMAAALEPARHAVLIDGNVCADASAATLAAIEHGDCAALGVSVMGGPQVRTAIDLSQAVRARHPRLPIVWGGYFPSLYPEVALNSDYVDYVVRGQGEHTLPELLDALSRRDSPGAVAGLSHRCGGAVVHNPGRIFQPPSGAPLPYGKLGDPRRYLVRTFMGQRTAAHQAALGCRFRCTFCGVAAMFRGATALPPAQQLERELLYLRDVLGADSLQFYDHNFFDREEDMVPVLETLARMRMPWWCYARADALINLSPESWKLVRQSRLRMAYIGAETPNDQLLRSIRKGTRSDQTLEVAELCRRQGVIPELSFMVAPPEDPEGETERTFEFIRQVKRVNPDAEIIVYVYTPLPTRPGSPSGCAGASAISSRCCAAASPRCRTRAPAPSRAGRCVRWLPGVTASSATTVPGNWPCPTSWCGCSIRAPRACDARAAGQLLRRCGAAAAGAIIGGLACTAGDRRGCPWGRRARHGDPGQPGRGHPHARGHYLSFRRAGR